MAHTPTSTCRVLLVEDDEPAARTLASLLREDGYDVEIVLDGAEAITRLGRSPAPDVLVVDYKLPHVDGLAVAAYGRSQHAPLVVVMVTSYSEVVARLDSHLDPPPVMLGKPLAYADLTRELERARPPGAAAR